MRRTALALAAAVLPGAAFAHDAFGDLGPFYASLLHPLADPAQGLLLAAAAVLLARQPVATVRPAYAALAACGALAMALRAVIDPPLIGLRVTGLAVAALGIVAISGLRLPVAFAVPLCAVVAIAAGLAVDLPAGTRAATLAGLGGAAGIALLSLAVWGGVDYATRRLGRIAGAVAGAWIAAIGIMAAALPA
jgi:urease accessory protein